MSPPFREIVDLLETIQRTPKHDTKEWRQRDYDFFELLQVLIPDTSEKIGFQQTSLAKAYVKFLCLPEGEAQTLLDWKKPDASHRNSNEGEFAEILFRLLEPRSTTSESTLTLHEVTVRLNMLRENKKTVEDVFGFFFQRGTALEQKWIVRIILKKMYLNLGENSILELFHPDAKDQYAFCRDLRKLCDRLKDPNVRVADEEKHISYMSAFKFMHLRKVLPAEVSVVMGNAPFWLQEKLDGNRVQMHWRKGEFRYFTRVYVTIYDLFSSGGAAPEETTWRSFVIPNQSLVAFLCKGSLRRLILDGEMMSYDPVEDRLISMAELYEKKERKEEVNYHPCFMVFDLLYMNNQCITNCTYRDRYRMLGEVVQEEKGWLQILPVLEKSLETDVHDYLEATMASGGEGIVVKNPESIYVPDERANKWVKVKPDYISELGEHLDVVVVGASYGKGRTNRHLASFLCAVRDGSQWLSFARFGSGFKQETRQELERMFLDKGQPFDPKSDYVTPFNIVLKESGVGRDKLDFILDPLQSVLVELKATQIMETDKFATPYTLRFPRFCMIRQDKGVQECMTKEELIQRYRDTKGQLLYIRDNSGFTRRAVPLQSSAGERVFSQLASQFKMAADLEMIQKQDDLFAGLRFYIYSGAEKVDRLGMQALVKMHGGEVTALLSEKLTNIVVVEKPNLYVKPAKDKGFADVVKPQWIIDCVDQNRRIPLEPKYVHSATKKTQMEMANLVDEFGDFYAVPLTPSGVRTLFENMSTEKMARLSVEDLPYWRMRICGSESPTVGS